MLLVTGGAGFIGSNVVAALNEAGRTDIVVNDVFGTGRTSVVVDTTFEKGLALAEWLINVGGSTIFGELVINAAQHTVVAVNTIVAASTLTLGNSGTVDFRFRSAPREASSETTPA